MTSAKDAEFLRLVSQATPAERRELRTFMQWLLVANPPKGLPIPKLIELAERDGVKLPLGRARLNSRG
jgi:hypothetical protein